MQTKHLPGDLQQPSAKHSTDSAEGGKCYHAWRGHALDAMCRHCSAIPQPSPEPCDSSQPPVTRGRCLAAAAVDVALQCSSHLCPSPGPSLSMPEAPAVCPSPSPAHPGHRRIRLSLQTVTSHHSQCPQVECQAEWHLHSPVAVCECHKVCPKVGDALQSLQTETLHGHKQPSARNQPLF